MTDFALQDPQTCTREAGIKSTRDRRNEPSPTAKNKNQSVMNSRRPSLAWTLFLVFLVSTQLQESEANLKLKKLLKKALLLRALAGKKGVTIIPIPIPLNLLKDKLDAILKLLEKPPEPMMPPMPYPMYMPMEMDKMMGYPMMMPKANEMPQQGGMMMMGNGKYGMMGGD